MRPARQVPRPDGECDGPSPRTSAYRECNETPKETASVYSVRPRPFRLLCARGPREGKRPVAKHIILIVGDGMQPENEIAASRYLTGTDDGLAFHAFPYRGLVATWDVTTYNRQASRRGAKPFNPSAIIPRAGCDAAPSGKAASRKEGPLYACRAPEGAKPHGADSASTATAWATGHKTDTGNIAWLPGDPDGGALKTIAELLREKRGYSIGIVTTVPFSDATPAAFVSHNKSRRNLHAIADEIIRIALPEVVIGGGHPARNGPRHMSIALHNEVKNGRIGDRVFVERKDGVDAGIALKEAAARAAAGKKKLFGLFGGPEGYFEPPVPTDNGTAAVARATIENPLLKDATLAALEVLGRNRNGFFLLVEQGDIDWANHANDYRWMIGAMWDLDEAVRAAVEFVNRPGDHIAPGKTPCSSSPPITSQAPCASTTARGWAGAAFPRSLRASAPTGRRGAPATPEAR